MTYDPVTLLLFGGERGLEPAVVGEPLALSLGHDPLGQTPELGGDHALGGVARTLVLGGHRR